MPEAGPGRFLIAGSAGFRVVSGIVDGIHFLAGIGGTAAAVRFSVTVRQVREDGSEAPVDGELAAALADPADQFGGLLAWAAGESGFLDHGEREDVIGQEGRELQRRLLEATFAIDSAREERPAPVASAAGIRHDTPARCRPLRLPHAPGYAAPAAAMVPLEPPAAAGR